MGFLRVVNYPKWLTNAVPVPKKDGKVRMCVDFRDLNKANLKDDFLLPYNDFGLLQQDMHCCHSWMAFQGIIR